MPELFAVDLRSRAQRQITTLNTDLTNRLTLVPTRRLSYRSDELDIEAFVLYPPGFRKGRTYP